MDGPCAKKAQFFNVTGCTIVSSNGSESQNISANIPEGGADRPTNKRQLEEDNSGVTVTDYNGAASSESATQFAYSGIPYGSSSSQFSAYPAIYNLIQTILAAVRIDLGNPNPNNFLLNSSVVNATLFNAINMTNGSSIPSILYRATTTQIQGLTLEGPAAIQVLYACQLQQAKPIGSAIISVLVATLSMFMSGWAVFMFISSDYAERREKSKSAEQVEQDRVPMLSYGPKEEEVETQSTQSV